MGTKIIATLSDADARGIYGIFEREIAAAKAVSTGRCIFVCQLPWGPVGLDDSGDLARFESPGAFRAKYCPAGFDRTGDAYNTATRFAWPDLKIIRVLASDALKATINLQTAGPVNCVQATAKYFGAAGNGITCVVAASSDGVANNFDLTVTKTNAATGKSTSEKYINVDSTQAAGAYWTNLTANSVLLGPLVKSAAGRPTNGTYTLAAGSNGSAIAASDYVGTPGSPDKGISLAELDPDVSFVFTDSLAFGYRDTVNAALAAHKTLMNDRRHVILCGGSTDTDATAKTKAALNQSEGVHYVKHWGRVMDEDATSDVTPLIDIPLAPVLAGFASLLQPHLSPAIKRREFTRYFSAIKGLTNGNGARSTLASLETAGVIGFEKNADGVFSPYSDISTDKTTEMFVSRMRRFIMFTIGDALDEYRNAPNDDGTTEDERTIASTFLELLVTNGKTDPYAKASVKAAQLLSKDAANTNASMAAGDYSIPYEVQLLAAQKRIILRGLIGKSVTLSVASGA